MVSDYLTKYGEKLNYHIHILFTSQQKLAVLIVTDEALDKLEKNISRMNFSEIFF